MGSEILKRMCLAWAFCAAVCGAALGAADAKADVDRAALAWQIALDRAGFSPGVIDGKMGVKAQAALREFQKSRGLPLTGAPDAATAGALGVDPSGAVVSYRVTAADLAQVGPVPRGWQAKARQDRLAYPTPEEMLAEKFHCTRALLVRLNGGRNLSRLAAGEEILVPGVTGTFPAARCERLEIDVSRKVVRALDSAGRAVAMFHCSVAADPAKIPLGRATIVTVVENPRYRFDPRNWPEVKGVGEPLLIPPGPRNPVGLRWMGLSRAGYGIHGTPSPEMIGKTGSHGCFRLTNWDAIRLSAMVRPGTPVRIYAGGALPAVDVPGPVARR
ncbi:MAG TPA: murein L,D-transpeptidase [Phycisphaerales bacterium]|nr:murein L,D-transpeptidase [Phycisphaerales bacterium]